MGICFSCHYFDFNGIFSFIKMIIGSISENINSEKRVAITPDIVKKYISLGLEIHLTKNYANHLDIEDEEYEKQGAKILTSSKEVISSSNADIFKQNRLII